MVIWITGLSGSGKSTLAAALYPLLKERSAALVRLDGDEIRAAFGGDLGYSAADRARQISRIQRIAIGNGRMITTNVLEKELLMLGENPGRTSLFIWTGDGKELKYTVNVVANDLSDTHKRLSALLSNMPGIKVDRVGQHVVVTGNASKVDLARIGSIVPLDLCA